MQRKQLFLLTGFLIFIFCIVLLFLYVSKEPKITTVSNSTAINSKINENIKPLEGKVAESQLEIEEIQNPNQIIYRLNVSALEPIFITNNIIKGSFQIKGGTTSPIIYFVFGNDNSQSIMVGQKNSDSLLFKTVNAKTFLELVKNKRDFTIQVSVSRSQLNDNNSYLFQQQQFYTLMRELSEQKQLSLPEPYEFNAEGLIIQ